MQYIHVRSCCTPKINTVLHVNYSSIECVAGERRHFNIVDSFLVLIY